jgi:hypothetical protein
MKDANEDDGGCTGPEKASFNDNMLCPQYVERPQRFKFKIDTIFETVSQFIHNKQSTETIPICPISGKILRCFPWESIEME